MISWPPSKNKDTRSYDMTTLTFHVTSLNPFLVAHIAVWPLQGTYRDQSSSPWTNWFLVPFTPSQTDHKPSGSDISWWEHHHCDKDKTFGLPTWSSSPITWITTFLRDCLSLWQRTACVFLLNSSWDVWQAVCEQKSHPKSSPSPLILQKLVLQPPAEIH